VSRSLQIELCVRVTDGSFETRLSFPIDATNEQRDGVLKLWLEAMRLAVGDPIAAAKEPAA
jgi:hypothetical protein